MAAASGLTGVDIATLIASSIAALASASSIGVAIWSHISANRHSDESWHRDQLLRAVVGFLDAASDAQNILHTQILQATGRGEMTAELRDEFRELQMRVHAEQVSILVLADEASLDAALRWVYWLDNGIQAFPRPGDPPTHLGNEHPLVLSLHAGTALFAAMIGPLRASMSSEEVKLRFGATPNRYGFQP